MEVPETTAWMAAPAATTAAVAPAETRTQTVPNREQMPIWTALCTRSSPTWHTYWQAWCGFGASRATRSRPNPRAGSPARGKVLFGPNRTYSALWRASQLLSARWSRRICHGGGSGSTTLEAPQGAGTDRRSSVVLVRHSVRIDGTELRLASRRRVSSQEAHAAWVLEGYRQSENLLA